METPANAYKLLFKAVCMIPISHYLFVFLSVILVTIYNFLEIHFVQDLLSGFTGSPVSLTFSSCSEIYDGVASKCRVLHGRYLATPWLSSPHIQTAFLNFFGRPPVFSYRRQLFRASDDGTLALDWLLNSDVLEGASLMNNVISKDDTTPIVVVIPGLMSDSASSYIKHIAFSTAKRGWNVVVSNHRGLGGVSITSDCFYNAGWTEDVRAVIDYLHREHPKAPLFAVGTSIGANILVKYLGEDGENVPIAGGAAVCSPWDLLIGDRFITRKLRQKFYDRALAFGLQGYAQLHQPHYSRLADWEGIKKSRSIRDFDNYATCLVGKFETVDTYYRRCSSTSYVGKVSVPLLCISALDDPVCTREAIPWDECRANKNIVLVTLQHGGHLAFFEGLTASSIWWVRAVDEFLDVLYSSPYMHKQKKVTQNSGALESTIDHSPFVNVVEDRLVAPVRNNRTNEESSKIHDKGTEEDTEAEISKEGPRNEYEPVQDMEPHDIGETSEKSTRKEYVTSSIRRCFDQLSRQNTSSMWLLAYIAIVTSWPLLGSALRLFFKRKINKVLPGGLLQR